MEIVQIYFTNLNKLSFTGITIFLAFFLFLFENFPLLDPDPGKKLNADLDPQPWFP